MNRAGMPHHERAPAKRAGFGTAPIVPLLLTLLALVRGAPVRAQESEEASLRAAVERYNRAFLGKDLVTLKALLAPDVVLYEHSVRNIGLDDVWEHHLRPEVEAFQDMRGEFTDMRVWLSGGVGIVTRQYSIQATMQGRAIDARGNETMGWARRDGEWKVVHIHYSHPCPRPSS
jgi:ketosteroid isomerase-like protein